ncbi:putative bifunctional diguanylate cyclase/phosphodiesterase [Vibrio quintilis]|uniref:Phytochrome-like protein cph2 n=1 Tax=Vibrio quintilis TaxID=1117707 RepID=A0A1M7YPQ3_9VIBR|nr:bifunctional diguanylate cyclase/phosphodiesterase [Vibrio quintilis]SHO54598.1 Phytochrome-like protein cph2 [Vibrio quintilis]
MKMDKHSLFRERSLQAISELIDTTDGSLYQQATDILHHALNSYASLLIEVDRTTQSKRLLATSPKMRAEENICRDLETLLTQQMKYTQDDYFIIPMHTALRFPQERYVVQHQIEGYFGTTSQSSEPGSQCYLFITLTTEPIDDPDTLYEWHQLIAQIVQQNQRHDYLARRVDLLLNRLNHEVSHDNLTNLMNKSYLTDTLERLMISPPETGPKPFSLGLLDIKNFSLINDVHGIYIGDQVLKHVAQIMATLIQDEQFVFRLANDEFAFITFRQNPVSLCEKMIKQISYGYHDTHHHISLKTRIGLATYVESSVHADELLLHASLALKECKTADHPICSYETSLSDAYLRKTELINALKKELNTSIEASDALSIKLQPIVRRHQSIWSYFEVLARWTHPTLGEISPIEFIEVAEESGLIISLGRRIIKLACLAKQEIESHGCHIRLSINCSAQELSQSHLYTDYLTEQITAFGFHPEEFTIEITETTLLVQQHLAKKTLRQLRTAGFKIALDDFGTGYSSLNYIHSYPIDCIKIDASFIKNMLNSYKSEKVVSLIIQLANQLNIDLVAEGVEQQHILNKLYNMGCSQIQGYWFSRPIPSQDVVRHLLNQSQTSASDTDTLVNLRSS